MLSKFLLLASFVLCSLLNASQLQAASKVSAIYMIDEQPYGYFKDNHPNGAMAAVVQEIQRRTGDSSSIIPHPSGTALPSALLEGENVAAFTLARYPQREKKFNFAWVGPIGVGNIIFVKKRGSALKLYSMDDARKVKSIGAALGRFHSRNAEILEQEGFKNIQKSTDDVDSVKKLVSGKLDLFYTEETELFYILKKAGIDPAAIETAYSLQDAPLYLVFSKKSDPATVALWQKALDDMKTDGSFNKIYTSHNAIPMNWYPPAPLSQ